MEGVNQHIRSRYCGLSKKEKSNFKVAKNETKIDPEMSLKCTQKLYKEWT